MPKLDDPAQEKWFNDIGKALAVAEKEDSDVEGEYRTLEKNVSGQLKRAESLDKDGKVAEQVKKADELAKKGEFGAALVTLQRASDKAMVLISSGGAKKGEGSSDGKKGMVPKAKGKAYEGEDKEYGWRKDAWNAPIERDSDRVTTRYETTEEERKASSKDVDKDGRLVAHQERDEKGVSKDGKEERPIADGQHGYVVDPKTGKMHTFDQMEIEYYFQDGHVQRVNRNDTSKVNELKKTHGPVVKQKTPHHTTPLAGKDVGGAGEIKTDDGHIREINDISGHYKPGEEQTHQTVKHLDEQGALNDDRTLSEALNKRRDAINKQFSGKSQWELPETVREELDTIETRLDNLEDEPGADKPMHREAKVKLVGKIGLTDEEFANAAGDKKAMYKIVAQKAKTELSLDLDSDPEKKKEVKDVIDEHFKNHPVMNMLIGKTFELALSKSQYLQTEGNERQARKKQILNKQIEDLGRDKADERKEKSKAEFEKEIEKLGGKDKVKEFGLDPEFLNAQEIFELLSGALPVSNLKPKHDKRKQKEEDRKEFLGSGESDSEDNSFEDIHLVPEEEEEEEVSDKKKKKKEKPPRDLEEMKKTFEEKGGDESVYDQICMMKGFAPRIKPIIKDKLSLEDKLAFLEGDLNVYEIWDIIGKHDN